MDLSKKLREERLKRKLSLRDAAVLTGISHTYLSALEKGYDPRTGYTIEPSRKTLLLLCNAYGLDITQVSPLLDIRDEDELYFYVAKKINSMKENDPELYAKLLDVITGVNI